MKNLLFIISLGIFLSGCPIIKAVASDNNGALLIEEKTRKRL